MQTFLMVACGLLLGVLALLMAAVNGKAVELNDHSPTAFTAMVLSFIASAALLIFARG